MSSRFRLTAASLDNPTRHTLLFRRLNCEVTADDLLERVLEFARPSYCRILTHPDGQSRGIGLVSFQTRQDAEATMAGFHRCRPNAHIDWADCGSLAEFLESPAPSFHSRRPLWSPHVEAPQSFQYPRRSSDTYRSGYDRPEFTPRRSDRGWSPTLLDTLSELLRPRGFEPPPPPPPPPLRERPRPALDHRRSDRQPRGSWREVMPLAREAGVL
jgi:hypothetical protein